jgi:hypothetical protein
MVGGAIADSAPTPEPCVAGPIDGAIQRRPSSPTAGRASWPGAGGLSAAPLGSPASALKQCWFPNKQVLDGESIT